MDFVKNYTDECIIFLDIDGVLTTSEALLEEYEPDDPAYYYTSDLCPSLESSITPLSKVCIHNLKWICDQVPNLRIVVSSTWREDEDYKQFLLSALTAGGIDANLLVAGDTPILSGADGRGAEIRMWLLLNPAEYHRRFCILDDGHKESFLKHQLEDHFVQTIMRHSTHPELEGLTHELAVKVVEILSR